MLEIRYRLTQPPHIPHPFSPWFEGVPDAVVHGTDIRFEGDVGGERIVAFANGGDLDRLERNLLAMPTPNAHEWRLVERAEDALVLAGEWREPIYPGVISPMRVAVNTLGPDTQCSFTIDRHGLVHRAIVPDGASTDKLWQSLRDELLRFCGFSNLPVALLLERLASYSPGGAVPYKQAREVMLAAFALGYYDEPPRASVQDVAVASGLTGAEAKAALQRVEADLLQSRN